MDLIANIFNPASIVMIIFSSLIFYWAYRKKKIDWTAIVATIIIGSLCLIAGGAKWLAPLIVFFIIGSWASNHKNIIKQELGLGQEIRTFRNVLANGGAAGYFAILAIVTNYSPNEILYAALVTSIAVALSDTLATELGNIYGKNYILMVDVRKVRKLADIKKILIWTKAQAGTTGAISIKGFIAALAGSAIITCFLLPLPILGYSYPTIILFLCLIFGFMGTIIDSFLGSTFEKWGLIDTHGVNFLTTLFAGGKMIFAIALFVQI